MAEEQGTVFEKEIDGPSIKVKEGAKILVIGLNGTGKSSLINKLLGEV